MAQQQQLPLYEGEAYHNFIKHISNPLTMINYISRFKKYIEYCRVENIDDLLYNGHVAHNVVIGRNCELTAGTIIGGSTTIGDTSWMGLNCTLKNKINVGSRVIVGCGAAVIKDVADEDIVAGVPA